MSTLFSLEPILPNGFNYCENFITQEEEHELITAIMSMELHSLLFQGFEAKRKTASFGYDWSFEKRTLSKGKDISPVFDSLLDKVARQLKKEKNDFAELLVTEYPVESVINWHRDAPPF